VVTGLLVFEGDGVIGEFVGGYNDYIRYRRQRDAAAARTTRSARSG